MRFVNTHAYVKIQNYKMKIAKSKDRRKAAIPPRARVVKLY
jgi:hypothetical protein